MAVNRLQAVLRPHTRIGLDTSIFIYALEANSNYVALADQVFAWLEKRGHSAVTSTTTMTELLVQPYRELDELRVDQFYALLSTYPNLEWIPPDLAIADIAARLRAEHRLATPDALQAATVLRSQATALVTNDAAFQRISGFKAVILDQLLEAGE